ncbi:putative cupin superfamily protein [Novosphingobium capsulatum]|uniref:Cupin superfamily protein n=1 Tax=Novosphingobium capsulatum TaxID=13688 RepID=A0ABU1MKW3_9SPHN|nr:MULTISPECIES: cupin domain-containing protein [Novosphingobium]MBB3358264.1 hypothetical protein [Novosphingobium sp. BK256]MBB3374625.1 hypothetical protein [Novosphingobium sp. BK280]MBB3379037.1 hypothetical protein [Novosphingobium sp. BK258]MBB3420731.1 hypothetical protein [Novosphingobium sp. BK267]MBB3448147.1 hypothetical protein [Novosphingobium sp. BK352]
MSVAISAPETGLFNPNPSDNWKPVEGSPTMKTWLEFQTADKTMVTGTWHSTTGTWHSENTPYHEYIYLIAGAIELTADGGETVSVKAGDAFMVEAGFTGTWKVTEPVQKRFCLRLA